MKYFNKFSIIIILIIISACSSMTEEQKINKIQGLYDHAISDYNLGKYESALNKVDEALDIEKGLAPLHILKGHILLDIDEVKKSIKSYTKAIEIEGNNSKAYLYRAIANKSKNNYIEFLEDIKTYIAYYPNEEEGYRVRYEYYLSLNDYSNALKDLKSILKLDFNVPMTHLGLAQLYQNLNQNDSSIKYFDSFLALTPDDDHNDIYFIKGKLNYTSGMYENAIEQFSLIDSTYEEYMEAIKYLANAHYSLKDYTSSLPFIDQYLESNPEDVEILKFRSEIFGLLGQNDLALNEIENRSKIVWEKSGVFYKYGWILLVLLVGGTSGYFIDKYRKEEYDRKLIWKTYLFFALGGVFGFHHLYLKNYFRLVLQNICLLVLMAMNSFVIVSYLVEGNYSLIFSTSTTAYWSIVILLSLFILDLLTIPYLVFLSNYKERKATSIMELKKRSENFDKAKDSIETLNSSLTQLFS